MTFKFMGGILQFVFMASSSIMSDSNVFLVIIHGKKIKFISQFCSDNTIRNSCTAENIASTCITSCSGGRKLDAGYCKCNKGKYDAGINECKECHYTWLKL